ncbi:Imm27 family immunity protein [Pararhizobium sp. BT-229]|uniref:Imm27 family immunity protein n=1 Tax=Pararhizobium sp. BT-229 TaxID=2986923 RepID=UPI0021F73FEA|nr:Imm27 family immunity protein [Pararhizobium sp. BT-229]MCV9965875.1 Imm27 family immunity protein [Pararhizobium sp. BT-229]
MSDKNEYSGEAALSHVKNLIEIESDADKWETEYRDEKTGEIWILDYPQSERHGGGSPRLRKK